MWGTTSLMPGLVTLFGFDHAASINGLWGILAQPDSSVPIVLGNGDSGLVSVDLRSGATTPYPASIHSALCDWGPGVTNNSKQYVLQVPGDTIPGSQAPCVSARWQVEPSLAFVDSQPSFSPQSSAGHRLVAELAPGRWLVSEKYDFALWKCDTTCVNTYWSPPNAPVVNGRLDGVHISPRGDLAAVDEYWTAGYGGAAVIDVASARVAWRVRSMVWAEGSAFSPSGDTLFIVGGDSSQGGHAWLAAVRTADSTLVDSVPLALDLGPGSGAGSVALDPSGRWIYASVVVQQSTATFELMTTHVSLVVLDRATLAPVAVLRSDSLSAPYSWGKQRIILDPANHQGYVVVTDIFIVPDPYSRPDVAQVFRFSFPP